jgi:hypothetical protein
MKPDEILIAKTASGITAEPSWWRFCVKADGRFKYEEACWSEKPGGNSQTNTGRLNEQELDRIKKIIPTLDEVQLEGFIIDNNQ